MKASFKIEGGKELSAALAELGVEATKAGEYAARTTAKQLRVALEEAAPIDPDPGGLSGEYGHLRDNLKVVKIRPNKKERVIYRVGIGHAFWGYIVEFGSAKMPAHPWFRPTWDRVKEALAAAQTKNLEKGIALAWKRAARKLKKK